MIFYSTEKHKMLKVVHFEMNLTEIKLLFELIIFSNNM